MNGQSLYEGIIVLVILMLTGIVVTVFVLLMGVSIMRETKKHNEKYEEVVKSNEEIKSMFKTEVAKLLDAFKDFVK